MPRKFRLEDLRFNPNPPPIKGGREFHLRAEEAFLKIEDILSLYAQGRIDFDYALRALNYAKNAIIPKMPYSEEEKRELLEVYEEAIRVLKRLRTPKAIMKWLLSHGPPRKSGISLLDFM